jgi:hypothetical protein
MVMPPSIIKELGAEHTG